MTTTAACYTYCASLLVALGFLLQELHVNKGLGHELLNVPK
jgi:hypothetical protein